MKQSALFPWLAMMVGGSIMAASCLFSCQHPSGLTVSYQAPLMNEDSLSDRLLGGLLGTAMGDAMGAPTEMWPREAIQAEYGHVSGLDDMVREPSGEGTWRWNLPAGGTTDDTRWKKLLMEVLCSPADPDPARALAMKIVQEHDAALARMKTMTSVNAEDYADELRKAHWLSEWAKVARPWLAGDHDAYQENLHRFYGGEMVCAGMIYAPAVGLRYPGDPMAAYEVAYRMDIYDIGYARDMTGLMAAMVAEACRPGASPDSILAVIRSVDPKGYFPARLVGRTAHKLLQTARWITKEAREVEVEAFLNEGKPPVKLALPLDTPEQRRRYAIWARAYQLLDAELRRMPFHPDEIWLVTLTGMLIGDFEMAQALPFIVNFGRDNDTSAAMAGAILGALAGASQLPQDWAKAVLRTSSSLDLDFPAMADELLGSILSSR